MIGRLHAIGACLIGIFFSSTYLLCAVVYIYFSSVFVLLQLLLYVCIRVCVCAWQDHLGLCPSYVTAPARLCAYFIHCFFSVFEFFLALTYFNGQRSCSVYSFFLLFHLNIIFFLLFVHAFISMPLFFFSFFHLFCCCWAMPSNAWCINQSNGCCV